MLTPSGAARVDVLLEGGHIAAVGADLACSGQVVEADEELLVPGLTDIHVHFRDPGREAKETLATGSQAAVRGGFTTVVCEPNTTPPMDTPERVRAFLERAAAMPVRVLTKACITCGREQRELTDFRALREAGAVALTDDGDPIMDDGLMREAMLAARECGMTLTPHCEATPATVAAASQRWPEAALLACEARLIERDLRLIEETGCRVHFEHVSLAASVELIRQATQAGLPVTAEATPHHAVLSCEDVRPDDANAKMNPPLRSPADVAAVRAGLADGTIEAIASDHAPHTLAEKAAGYDAAPFGVIGLETTLGVVLTRLVGEGVLTLAKAMARLTTGPREALGLEGGLLEVGAPGDLTIIDFDREWSVDPAQFASQGRNTPFAEWQLRGRATRVICRGRLVGEGEAK
jgi:dihydroorotase